MSLDAFIGVAGCLVTVLVVAGMILLTPRGAVDSRGERTGPEASNAGPPSISEEPRAAAGDAR